MGLAGALRAACPLCQSQREHFASEDAAAGTILGEHEPSISLGQRHELRRRNRAARGAGSDGWLAVSVSVCQRFWRKHKA